MHQHQSFTSNHTHATYKIHRQEIAKPITPSSELPSEEDSDYEQAQRDKDMQKNLALITKYFKKIYKPTNNNLRTSLKPPKQDVILLQDTRMTIRLTVGKSEAVNVARNAESKRVKDITYHKEKMFCCVNKLEERFTWQRSGGFLMQTQAQTQSIRTVETGDSNVIPDSPDMCDNDIQDDQNDVECDDERVGPC
ncbi:hypothetical protein Tco_0363439 [Tanacetum coccineum]